MSFHGIRATELSTDNLQNTMTATGTSIVGRASIETTASLPVVIGRAPVHLTENPAAYVNKAVICYTWDDAVNALGYSDDWNNYELCEAMFSEFKLYGAKPVVFINVLDPATHKTAVSGQMYDVTDDEVVISDSALLDSFVVKTNSYTTTAMAIRNTDYTLAYNSEGKVIISIIDSGNLASCNSIYVAYDKINPAAVTYQDVVGGISTSGALKGLELIDAVYTQFGIVPGIIAAPNWSENPTVAAVMKAKAEKVSSIFPCICLTDIDTEQVRKYGDAYAWKTRNGYTGSNQVVCWPCVKNGNMIFHMSTHLMGVIAVMDAENGDVPYMSPSNHAMRASGICLKDGTEILLTLDRANLLNDQGIVTGLNFNGGFKIWGDYTGIYPSSTDPKDIFICCRRMFDWQRRTFIINYWQYVDQPLIPRVVRSLVDNERIRLNSYVARGYLLFADVQFYEEENPLTDLLAGKLRLHIIMTPPVPAKEIEAVVEYDVSAYSTLLETISEVG